MGVLAQAIEPRYQGMVLLAAYGGLRLGEVGVLGIADLDMMRRIATVHRNLVELDSGQLSLGPTKFQSLAEDGHPPPAGHRPPRRSPCRVRRWLRRGGFHRSEGGFVRFASWRRRYWYPAVKEAGLEPLRFHDLRHTHAALLIAQGEHPKFIQARMGHTSISTTLDTYGHLMEGLDAGVADRLDERFEVPRSIGFA